jgi:hypothetical protein
VSERQADVIQTTSVEGNNFFSKSEKKRVRIGRNQVFIKQTSKSGLAVKGEV